MRFVIPGQPVAKARPRARVVPGQKHAHIYTPKKSARFEDRVALCALEAGLGRLDGPVMVVIIAFWEWPRSMWRKRKPRGPDLYAGGPDADNVAKSCLDGMSGHFNDRQVCVLHVHKWRCAQGESSRTEVEVNALPLKEDTDA